MATVRSQDAICSIVKYGILELKTKAGRTHDYNGVVLMDNKLIVLDRDERNLQVFNRHDGKLISTSHRLEDILYDVCLISKTEVAVCLSNGTVVILSLKSIDDVKLVKTLWTGFYCQSLAKWNSDKLVISGWKDGMLCWRILSITDGHLDSTHDICKGNLSHIAVKDNTLYISCRTDDSITKGVYAFDFLNPNTRKFLYQHQELKRLGSIMADRDYVYVCDLNSNRIHQLTDSGQLVTIHTVSSDLFAIFYDDQHGLLYTTSFRSNVITVYKMESLHPPDSVIPAEVLKMDTRSLQMYKKALCDGYEKVYNIRVMVVGQYGVGKTTLTQRLLGKNVNISERHSTEGIDVHVECSKVSLPAGEWTTQEKNAEKYSRLQRLVRLLNEHSNKQESKREQERQSEMADQVTSVEYDNGHTQHGQLIIAEPSTYQKVKQPSSQPVESPIVRLGPDASSGIHSKENEKDTVMKILKQVNENSGKLEKDAVQYAALALWDFAGQYAFYTTHQTFLTSRAIYLLVIDLSQQVTDLIKDDECFLDAKGKKLCNIPEMIEIWLNMIHFCSPSSHPGNPPVILIGTHVDKIPEKDRQKIIDEYFMKIRQMLKNKPLVFHLMDDIAIDNTQCDPSLEKLKRRIFELASQQPHWGEEKPARWLPLEQAIMTMKDSDVKVAPLSLIEEINRSSSIKIEDRSELEMFLSFQHAIGTILYFNADGLREKIVLDPQWMIDVFRSLITAKKFIQQNPTITKEWFEFEEKGKLTHKLIDAIWTKKEKPDFHDNKEYLILVMKTLNIIARPMSYTMDGKSVKGTSTILAFQKEDYYLAPCILRQETPREMICPESGPNEKSTSALCFVCKEKCLPPPIFHRLVGACLTHFPIAKQDEENLIYCGCCVFDIDNYHRLSLHFLGHVIFARVTIMGVTDTSKSSKLCSEARKFIFENLLKIIGNLGQSLEFEPHIQCPSCDADSLKGMIAVPELQKEKVVVCHSHVKSHTLESQQLLKFWFEDGEQTAIEGKGREKGFKVDETSEVPEKVPPTSRNTGVPCSDPKLLCQLLQKSQQASSANQSTLEANCLSVGLELHGETPADGNCFFEAVSSQLRRLSCVVQKSPQQLRQEVTAFMRANRVIQASEGTIHLDSFIYNESFDDYCSRMARDSEWADHVVVVAMARMLQIDIMIVTSLPSLGPENIIVWVVGKTDFQEDPILLGHVWESHYMSLQPIEKLHEIVLNRCLPNLMNDLNVGVVMMYIQQQELFDDVTIRDIREQRTATNKISHLIDQIKKRDQDTYERFKECLILANQADLKQKLEEEEENVAEMKEKHQGVPIEILKMDDRSIQLFEEALKDGMETVHSIRIMVVGYMGVGKTTLVKRLLGEEVNISERHSTEGIDVYVNCCNVSLSTHEWTRRTKDSEQDYRLQRIAKVLNDQHSVVGKVSDESVPIPLEVGRTENLEDSHPTVKDQNAEVLHHHSSEQDIAQDLSSATNQKEESTADEQDKITAEQQEESTAHQQEESTAHQQEESTAHQQEESTAHQQKQSTADEQKQLTAELQENYTAHQQEESSSAVVQKEPTQSETNTMAMIKLLKENVNKIEGTGENSLLTIWDFAGQYAFYTTHQTFLTRRAIYLLVSDVSGQVTDLVADDCYFDSKGLIKCQVHELNEVWLNSIHSCASSPEDGIPPVILIGTHVDKISQGEIQEMCESYFTKIRSYLKDKPTRFHLIDEDFAIDNTIVDRKLEDLKRKIVEVASQQPYWGEKIPARWILLEQELMRRKADGVKVISRDDVEKINKEGTVQIDKSEELDLFLRFLHETGTIIYFSIEILRENIVLDPTWLIDALKTLINAQPDLPEGLADSVVSQKWSDFKGKGILSLELIDAIWTKEKYPELHAHKDHMLLIMEQLNIIAKPRAFSEIGEKIESYFLAPCMLRQESPREIVSPEQDPLLVSTPVLCCVFTGNFLPPPIFHRLIAACITHWPVAKKKETSENLIFCGCCIFNLDLFHRLTLYCKNHIVFARITRLVVDEVKTPDAALCTRVRKFITLNLSKITSYLGQNLKYELCTWWSPSQVVSKDGNAAPFQMFFADEGHDYDAPISPEHMNHARIYVALVTVCTNALRDILLTHVPNTHTNIYQAIRAKKADLTNKRKTRQGQWQNALLNSDQCQVVFPDPFDRYVASVDQFDISLLYILIRNVSTVSASLMGWGIDPREQPSRDRCIGASVERIRLYRNKIGHSMDGKMTQVDFDDYWSKIDAVLDDIEVELGRQGYRAELEKQRRQVISVYEAC